MIKKILRFIVLLVVAAICGYTYLHFSGDGVSRPKEYISQITSDVSPVGKFSEEGVVPSIESYDDFVMMRASDFATVVPTAAIPTGIYQRRAWIDANENGSSTTYRPRRRPRSSSNRPIPLISTSSFVNSANMYEYYILELADGENIFALLEPKYAKQINSGKEVELPIGKRYRIPNAAQKALFNTAKMYDSEVSIALYMYDNEWYEANKRSIKIKAAAYSAGVLILLLLLSFRLFKSLFKDF